MVPLAVIVRHKLVDDVAHTSLAEENYPIETLFADRAHPMIEVLSTPWIRLLPHVGFSVAIRTMSLAICFIVLGHPGRFRG